ncbi:MAG: signal peptidase I [Patescibacteria group bacterium]
MKIINAIFSAVFIVILLLVSSLFLVPLLPFENNIQIKIVESGSMEPSILTGSLVVIHPKSAYGVGDVVTFESTSADVPTTHRIIGIRESAGKTFFMTKGDANEEADTQEAPLGSVIGKVVIAAPYAGFVLDFARQPLGFLFLIVLPALMIICGEIEKIWKQIKESKREKNEVLVKAEIREPEVFVQLVPVARVRMMDIARPVAQSAVKIRPVPQATNFAPTGNYVVSSFIAPFCIVVSSFLFTAMSFTGSTVSYFNDIETAIENLLQASALDFSLSPENYNFLMEEDTEALIEPVITIEAGKEAVTYDIDIEVVSLDSVLCTALLVDATIPFLYSGALVDLQATSLVFNDAWGLTVTLNPEVSLVGGETCTVNLVYTATRDGAVDTAGYDDMEKIVLQFSTPKPEVALPAVLLPLTTETDSLVPVDENIEESDRGTLPLVDPLPNIGEEKLLQPVITEPETISTEAEIKAEPEIEATSEDISKSFFELPSE